MRRRVDPQQVWSLPAKEKGVHGYIWGKENKSIFLHHTLGIKQYSFCPNRTTHPIFPALDPDYQQRILMLGVRAEKIGKEAVVTRISI